MVAHSIIKFEQKLSFTKIKNLKPNNFAWVNNGQVIGEIFVYLIQPATSYSIQNQIPIAYNLYPYQSLKCLLFNKNKFHLEIHL